MSGGAVFDVDGVLVDSFAAVTSSINAALRGLGLPAHPPAQLRRFIGPPTHSAFAELLGRPADSAEVAEAVASYRAHYASIYLEQTPLFDGIPAALEAISQRLILAVATSKSAPFAQPLLRSLGLAPLFAVVAAADPHDPGDDKTAIVGRALEGLRALGAREVAIVGDRRFDIEAGLAHGLQTIGVAWGIGSVEELRAAGAHAIAATPAELLEMLTRGR